MKKTLITLLFGILAAGSIVPAGAQDAPSTAEPSLGSYARNIKKNSKPQQTAAKKFDNDNLPKNDTISVVGDETPSDGPASASAAGAGEAPAASGANEKMTVQPGQNAAQRQQVYDQWQQRINTQQSQVDLLQRELDVEQREYKIRAAAFYADAGDRLRNQAEWDKEDADYKQKIADKQKAVDDARQQMNDMQEDARKSGVPSSAREPVQQSQP